MVSFARAPLRACSTTRWPSAISSSAAISPSPVEDPVTNTRAMPISFAATLFCNDAMPAQRAPASAGAQFKAVYLLLQAMESGIADFAAVAHGEYRPSRRRGDAQAQPVALEIRCRVRGPAIRLQQGRLQLDAKGFGDG